MASSALEELTEEFERHIGDIELALGKGSVEDYPAYREEVGRIRGLRTAIRIVDDLQRRYTEDHDE